MADILPSDRERLYNRLAVEREPFPWGKLGLFLLAVGAGAWAYYHYVWQYRLPQERTLTTQDGKVMQVRMEARAGDLLKFTLLSDGTKELYPISLLADEDQVFVRKLEAGEALHLPLNYTLHDAKGNPQTVSIKGYNNFFLQYTTSADQQTHYEPLADLSELDRAVVDSLPSSLTISYPFDYFLVDAAGKRTPVEIVGRDDAMIKYTVVADGSTHLTPIKMLSDADQALLQTLPYKEVTVEYPVEYTLKDASGKANAVKILGRSNDIVKYALAADGLEQLKPLSALAPAEESFILTLPSSFRDQFPLKWTLTDKTGKPQLVEIAARSKDVLQYILLSADEKMQADEVATMSDAITDGAAHYCLLTALTAADQNLLRLYPTGLRVAYPFACTLTDGSGQTQKVKVLGQTRTTVKFSLLPDGKTYDYDLTKLSEADQGFLNTLPKTLKVEVPPPPIPTVVQALREAMISAAKKKYQMEINASAPNLSDGTKLNIQKQISDAQDEMNRDYLTIEKNFDDRIVALQQDNVMEDGRLANGQLSTDEKNAVRDQIDKNTQTIAALRDQLKTMDVAGALTDAGAGNPAGVAH
jgi:hypothetical protein